MSWNKSNYAGTKSRFSRLGKGMIFIEPEFLIEYDTLITGPSGCWA